MNNSIINPLGHSHPYYPIGVAIPQYVSNTMDAFTLVTYFGIGVVSIFVATYVLAIRTRPTIGTGDLLCAMWWAMCGFIHLFFEGYFSFTHTDIASRSDLFGQLWKEYSLSDSRYMTQDPFLIIMESITAFLWGPISFFIVYATVTDHSWRYPVQLFVSMGQLYGDLLYYGLFWYSEFVLGVDFSRPEKYYYWAYMVLCNAFWIVIPLCHIAYSSCTLAKTYEKVKAVGSVKKQQ
ncbi:hypothetical protein Golomagni_05644 [Golovinomyces magnicellulatus]|nr:hypothetical protein Golomagni_05644 [Golovinomyces magnicellulatus]